MFGRQGKWVTKTEDDGELDRRVKKTLVKDIVESMKEAGEEEIELEGRRFFLTRGFGVSKK